MPDDLRALVQRMIDAGESEANIATVIRSATASQASAPDLLFRGPPVTSDSMLDPSALEQLNEQLRPLAHPQSAGEVLSLLVPTGVGEAIGGLRTLAGRVRSAAANTTRLRDIPAAVLRNSAERIRLADLAPKLPPPSSQWTTTVTEPSRGATRVPYAAPQVSGPPQSPPNPSGPPRVAKSSVPAVETILQNALDEVRQARRPAAPVVPGAAPGGSAAADLTMRGLQDRPVLKPAPKAAGAPTTRPPVAKPTPKPKAPPAAVIPHTPQAKPAAPVPRGTVGPVVQVQQAEKAAKVKLNGSEMDYAVKFVRDQKMSGAEAIAQILKMRAEVPGSAFAKLPSDAEVLRRVTQRNATGRWE